MANNHYIKRLVACAVQFDKDFHKMEAESQLLTTSQS